MDAHMHIHRDRRRHQYAARPGSKEAQHGGRRTNIWSTGLGEETKTKRRNFPPPVHPVVCIEPCQRRLVMRLDQFAVACVYCIHPLVGGW